MPVAMSVFICALPRTGSSLLGGLLHRSGAVGWPGEWFWREEMERNRTEWGTATWSDYLTRVLQAGTSETGVFAAKVMWGYLHELLFELRRLAREYDADDLTVLRASFPDPRFVWVRRGDFVAQAVSWAKAVQTNQWIAEQTAVGEARFDFRQIDSLYHLARVSDGAWRRWFAAHDIRPYRVTYEELSAAPERVGGEVLAALGLEPEPGHTVEVPLWLSPQADRTNAAWAARYRRLAGLELPGRLPHDLDSHIQRSESDA